MSDRPDIPDDATPEGLPADEASSADDPSEGTGMLGEGEERPRRSRRKTVETPSGWRSSRRGSKSGKKARKEQKAQKQRDKVGEAARKTGLTMYEVAYRIGIVILVAAGTVLATALLFTLVNGVARWNAQRIADLENSPEALLEKAKDNLLFIAEEDGNATGFLAVKVEGENEQIYGIAIPDGAFVEVPGQGFERIGDSFVAGPDVSLAAVTNFFGVPFSTYAVLPIEAYQEALTEQSLAGVMDDVTDTNLEDEQVERWDTIFETVETESVALVPMPVKPINVGSQTYFEPQRAEISDLVEQWWGVSMGDDEDVVRVIVYNGAGTPGVAGVAAQELIQAGYRVVDTRNADNFDYEETQIVVQRGDQATGDSVVEVLGVGAVAIQPADQDVAEVIIIIGQDYEVPE